MADTGKGADMTDDRGLEKPPRHCLSTLDAGEKRATCSICGPGISVKAKRKNDGSHSWRCVISERRWKGGGGKATPHQRRKRKYGLREEEYLAMRQRQHDRCAICRKQAALVVDHCHETGRVRGLLCQPCNLGVGFLGDDPDILRRAAQYVKSAPAPREVETGALF